MKHETQISADLTYAPYRISPSRLFFRGPRRPADGQHITFIGSTTTYGKFIPKPFPTLVEGRLGYPCLNFGVINGSIDAFMNEHGVKSACRDAQMNVVEVMGAHNMSNRFFTVHPRRNDRFLRASTVLRALYPEVDFSTYCFTRHLLNALYDLCPQRFDIVETELKEAWTARMHNFLREIGSHTVLLWFAPRLPNDTPMSDRIAPFEGDPLFVSRSMIDTLRPMVNSVVLVQPSARAQAKGTAGMVVNPAQQDAADQMLNAAAHEEAAVALCDVLQTALPEIKLQA